MNPVSGEPSCAARRSGLLLDVALSVAGPLRIEGACKGRQGRVVTWLCKLGVRKDETLRAAFSSEGTYVDQHLWAIVGGLERARPGSFRNVRRG
jgi:hypothetical protein